MPEESSITLKSASDYQLLGKRVVNASAADIVVGNPIFGIDATAPGMVYATYVKCPSIGGIAKSANLDAVKALPGVIDAFILEGTPGALDFGAFETCTPSHPASRSSQKTHGPHSKQENRSRLSGITLLPQKTIVMR